MVRRGDGLSDLDIFSFHSSESQTSAKSKVLICFPGKIEWFSLFASRNIQ